MNSSEVLQRTENGVKESNKLLIRELFRDLEEKGIPPVIGVNGKVAKLKLVSVAELKTRVVDESEIEDAVNAIARNGYSENDFWFAETDQTECEQTTYVPTGIVIVASKKTGKMREYKAGNGSSWAADFEHDLENKFFTDK